MLKIVEKQIEFRECTTVEELSACVELQREVFALPELEISPVRHLIVTKNAGGFILGAFDNDELVGFVLSVPAFLRGEKAFYSHMTAVRESYQSTGVGRRLKWAQRERSLSIGVKFVKWTFEPWKARNAYFNLEKLGAIIPEIHPNFYGIDYVSASTGCSRIGLASDRLFAEWHLESDKVIALSQGDLYEEMREPELAIDVTPDWSEIVAMDPAAALEEQERLRREFEIAFSNGVVCEGFRRSETEPKYLFFR